MDRAGRDGDPADSIDLLLREVAHAPAAAAASVPAVAFGSEGVTVRDEPDMPERLGRFALRRTLGAGGMGIIYEAHDPTLDRHVAIKCLRAEGAEPTLRLLREAQALARLAHPNVVTIYEVGQEGDRVYLAMELVHGTTARTWRSAAPRTEREILAVWHQASAGLAAAHAAGLVHRDVKPENVLVGDDGRVRISDFGLAAAPSAASAEPDEPAAADPLATPLTRAGARVGTPPYMSPEALAGDTLDARSDQWSLCVSLWEALSGERPFVGATQAELAAAIGARPITRGREAIAPAVRAVLERGLAVEPAARWPSVTELTAALDTAITAPSRSRRGKRRVWVAAGAGGVAALAAAWVALDRDDRTPPAAAREAIAPPAAAPVRMTEPGRCPYMPIYGDDSTVVFDDGNGDLWKLPRGGTATPLVTGPTNDWRPSRGQRPGEILFVRLGGKPGKRAGRTTLDGRALDDLAIDSASFAYAGDVLFYARTDLGEIRRVRDGEDRAAFKLPAGRWPYTIAVSSDGTHAAVITSADRSVVTLCLAELDPATSTAVGAVECLARPDITAGRAAFAGDGASIFYPTTAGIRRRAVRGELDTLWLPGVSGYSGIDVSPDGTHLVFGDGRPAVLEALPTEPAGPAALSVPAGSSAPVAGPDGTWFYTRPARGDHLGSELAEVIAEGASGLRVLAGPLRTSGLLDVAPAGTQLAVDVDGSEPGIHVIDVRALPPVRVTTDAADSNPVWIDDHRIAFTRWRDSMQPVVMITDLSTGARDDASRAPAHPLPRVTLARIPGTGELVLGSLDGRSLWRWHPDSKVERPIDRSAVPASVLQAAVSPDGRTLGLLLGTNATWRLDLATGAASRAAPPPPCGTADRPVWVGGQLHAVHRRWIGDVWEVALR